MNKNIWYAYDEGKTLGNPGSENGRIRLDEEYPLGTRITLEEGGYQAWSITCGIYGCMFHTAFALTESEAHKKYDEMKTEIGQFLEHIQSDAVLEDEAPIVVSEWCEKFVDKF